MEDLVESILDYIRSDYTDYAVMLNGEWGPGKTHFWNNKIKKKIESMQLNGKRYTTIYMSLSGISNLEEILSAKSSSTANKSPNSFTSSSSICLISSSISSSNIALSSSIVLHIFLY